MAFDSLALLCAAALFAACIAGWRMAASLKAPARLPLRFGAVLLSALAAAMVFKMGDVTAVLLLPLASAALALAALARLARSAGPLVASVILAAALLAGLAALVGGSVLPGLVIVLLAGLCIVVTALQAVAVSAVLSGVALLAAGLCLPQTGAGSGVLLFAAAAVIGLARPQSLRSTTRAARAAVLP